MSCFRFANHSAVCTSNCHTLKMLYSLSKPLLSYLWLGKVSKTTNHLKNIKVHIKKVSSSISVKHALVGVMHTSTVPDVKTADLFFFLRDNSIWSTAVFVCVSISIHGIFLNSSIGNTFPLIFRTYKVWNCSTYTKSTNIKTTQKFMAVKRHIGEQNQLTNSKETNGMFFLEGKSRRRVWQGTGEIV